MSTSNPSEPIENRYHETATQPLLKVSEVATRLACAITTVYSLLEAGKLGHYRCPGIRVSEEQLAEYLRDSKREDGPIPQRRVRPRPRLKHIKL
jgi:excisionase family DNA binding protein